MNPPVISVSMTALEMGVFVAAASTAPIPTTTSTEEEKEKPAAWRTRPTGSAARPSPICLTTRRTPSP